MNINGQTGNVQLMQRINRLKVLDIIRKKGPLARPEIARLTGLSPSSITNIVTCLLEKHLVAEKGTVDTNDVGRKATLLEFNPAVHHIAAVNIGVGGITYALARMDGVILSSKLVPGRAGEGDDGLQKLVGDGIGRLIGESEGRGCSVAAAGISVSALVKDEGRFVQSSSLKWSGPFMREQLESDTGLPVFILNSTRSKALWALRSRFEEDDRNVIFLDLALGVGIVSFLDHRISEAVIGEFGHTTVKRDGPKCFCGNRGCLEMMCSVEAVLESCADRLASGGCPELAKLMRNGSAFAYDTVLAASSKGDQDVRSALRECGEYLGIGIANLVNLFGPQRIIVNGDVLLKSDLVYETALAEAYSRASPELIRSLKLQTVTIGSGETLQGVVLYAADRLFELPGSIL